MKHCLRLLLPMLFASCFLQDCKNPGQEPETVDAFHVIDIENINESIDIQISELVGDAEELLNQQTSIQQ